MQQKRSVLAVSLASVFVLLASACGTPSSDSFGSDSNSYGQGDFADFDGTPVIAAVSSEKVNLFTRLSELFVESPEAKALDTPAQIFPIDVASGEAQRLLTEGWTEEQTSAPRPVIWSPASTTWVNRVAAAEGNGLVPDPESFARTPVVIAMPEPMAKTLGWPDQPIGLSDLLELCLNPDGWGSFGGSRATWGNFKLGKTTPETSTTGLNMLLMQAYAASGKQSGLTPDDVTASAEFSRELESCVIHYGDTTGNVLQRNYDRDQQGQPLDYISAIAVEETSLINYNLGNPTSRVVKEGEELTPPKEQLVAVYPSEGSLVSDNPIVVLGPQADWVTEEQREAAEAFKKFVQSPAAQAVLGEFGFRPVDSSVAPSGLVSPEYGVDPSQPSILLESPSVESTSAALLKWQEIRKPSSVLILVDISGSMSDSAGNGETRLEESKKSAISALDRFRPTDEVGFWTFTTGVSDDNIVRLRDVSPLIGAKETLIDEIEAIQAVGGTPLYDAVAKAYEYMKQRAEPGRINAIILLSDGDDRDSRIGLSDLKMQLGGNSEVTDDSPVRIFSIVYGNASLDALQAISEATGGQVFNSTDPGRLQETLQKVVRNF